MFGMLLARTNYSTQKTLCCTLYIQFGFMKIVIDLCHISGDIILSDILFITFVFQILCPCLIIRSLNRAYVQTNSTSNINFTFPEAMTFKFVKNGSQYLFSIKLTPSIRILELLVLFIQFEYFFEYNLMQRNYQA